MINTMKNLYETINIYMEYIFRTPYNLQRHMIHNTHLNTNTNTNTNTNMNTQRRRAITCSLCRKSGHNIRSCDLYETTKKEGIRLYSQFVYHAITGAHNKWDYTGVTPDTQENAYYNVPSEEMLQIYRQHQDDEDGMLTAILSTPLQWLLNLSSTMVKGLKYSYTINQSVPNENIYTMLHFLFVTEADSLWMRSTEVPRCVPYLIKSLDYLSVLETMNNNIYDYGIVSAYNRVPIVIYIESARRDRLQLLYNQNTRALRINNMEVRRYERNVREYNSSILQLQSELEDLQDAHSLVLARREAIMEENRTFPPEFLRKCIAVIQKDVPEPPPEPEECAICYTTTTPQYLIQLNCKHVFCTQCVLTMLSKKYNRLNHTLECACPMCRARINELQGNKTNILHHMQSMMSSNPHMRDIEELIG